MQYELPGLWLGADEIHALLTMQHLLANLDAGGLLGPHIEPLMKRLGLLSHPALREPGGLSRLGIEQVMVARRISVGKFINSTRARPLA